MDKNLISYAKVTDKNKIVSIENTSKIYKNNHNLIGIAFKKMDFIKFLVLLTIKNL